MNFVVSSCNIAIQDSFIRLYCGCGSTYIWLLDLQVSSNSSHESMTYRIALDKRRGKKDISLPTEK